MINIRPARQGDAPSLARVHIRAWQEAYRGLLQQVFLDELPKETQERTEMWRQILQNPKRWAWVAEVDQEIVGFVLFDPPRDSGKDGAIELGAIYLLEREKRKGIGYSLLSTGFKEMKQLGYSWAYCWVLAGNPTIQFYQRTGAVPTGEGKEDEIGGIKYQELCYQWKDISLSIAGNLPEIPLFSTFRLILRGVERVDIPSYAKHFIDYEVIRHLSSAVPWPYPENGVSDFLEKYIFPDQGKTQWMWGIFQKENPTELIGAVHLWRQGRPEHRGFWLGRNFWGRGYMTEAVEPVTDFAFNELEFEKLILTNAVGNLRSRRVKEKAGAVFLGVQPAKFVDPTYTEHEVWELTKSAWQE